MTPVTFLSNARCGFEGHLVWQWQLNLFVGKQINLSKGHHLFWCSVPPFCFLTSFFLYLLHPLSVTRVEAVTLLRGRYETWLVKADKRRLLHISILQRTATAWLRLYGLLLYSCLRTGIGTCSRMPIRQPWLIQLPLAGALPAASLRLCCRLVLRCAFKGTSNLWSFFVDVPLYHLNSCEPPNHFEHLAGVGGLSASSVVWQQAGQRMPGGREGEQQDEERTEGLCLARVHSLANQQCFHLYIFSKMAELPLWWCCAHCYD